MHDHERGIYASDKAFVRFIIYVRALLVDINYNTAVLAPRPVPLRSSTIYIFKYLIVRCIYTYLCPVTRYEEMMRQALGKRAKF